MKVKSEFDSLTCNGGHETGISFFFDLILITYTKLRTTDNPSKHNLS